MNLYSRLAPYFHYISSKEMLAGERLSGVSDREKVHGELTNNNEGSPRIRTLIYLRFILHSLSLAFDPISGLDRKIDRRCKTTKFPTKHNRPGFS